MSCDVTIVWELGVCANRNDEHCVVVCGLGVWENACVIITTSLGELYFEVFKA